MPHNPMIFSCGMSVTDTLAYTCGPEDESGCVVSFDRCMEQEILTFMRRVDEAEWRAKNEREL